MKKIFTFLVVCFALSLQFADKVFAQDSTTTAVVICGGNKTPGDITGMTTDACDPALSCSGALSKTVWFKFTAIGNGQATISLYDVNNPNGLAMAVYTGNCGAWSEIPGSCMKLPGILAGATQTSSVFNVTAGNTYYVMVDGVSGNSEKFQISVNSVTVPSVIYSRPTPFFTVDTYVGCEPLCVNVNNLSIPNGTPITYDYGYCTPFPTCQPSNWKPTNLGFDQVCLNTMGNYSLVLKDSNDCGLLLYTQNVIVQKLQPNFSYTPNPACVGTPLCFNGTATLNPQTSPPTPANLTQGIYKWGDGSPNDTIYSAGPYKKCHTFPGAGPYTVWFVVYGTCGPDSTSQVINLLPPPIITAPPVVVCDPNPATLTVSNIQANNPNFTYTWTGSGTINQANGVANATPFSSTVTGLNPGVYYYDLHIVDGIGCIADTQVKVIVKPKPKVKALTDTTVCKYSPVQLGDKVIVGTAPITCSWSPSTYLNNPNSCNPISTPAATTQYFLTITDSAGCISDPDTIDVKVFTPPTLSFNPPNQCGNSPLATFTVSGPIDGTTTYAWTGDPGLTYNPATQDANPEDITFPSNPVPAQYNVQVILVDTNNCKDTLKTVYNIVPPPTVTISPKPAKACLNDPPIVLTAAASDPLATFVWTPGNATTNTISIPTNAPINKWYKVIATVGNCSDTDSVYVRVYVKPVAVAKPIPQVCGCQLVNLVGTGSSTGSNITYSWTPSPPATPGNTINGTANICNPTTFTLTVTDTTGCFNDSTTLANVLPKPAASASANPNMICDGVCDTIQLTGINNPATPGGVTWEWFPKKFFSNGSDTLQNPKVVVCTATTFTLVVTDTAGCDSTTTVTVNTYPKPTLTALPNSFCTSDPQPYQSTVTVSGAGVGSTIDWFVVPACFVPNSVTPNSVSQLFDVTACGTGGSPYEVKAIVTNPVTGCIDTISTKITISPGPKIVLTPTADTICLGQSSTIVASGAASFDWRPGNILNDTLTVKPLVTTTYTVVGTTGGCKDSAFVTIVVNPLPVLPPITGPVSLCEGAKSIPYSISPFTPNSTYIWGVGTAGSTGGFIQPGSQLVFGVGLDSILVNWPQAGTDTVYVAVQDSNKCFSALPQILVVTVNPNPAAPVITGKASICEGTCDNYFSSTPQPGFLSTIWSVSNGTPTTATGSPVNICWGNSPAGVITAHDSVLATGCISPNTVYNVTLIPNPIVSAITGKSAVCGYDSNVVYTVNPGAANEIFLWTLNTLSQGTIAQGDSTSSVFIHWGPGQNSDTITVTPKDTVTGCVGTPQTFVVSINLKALASLTIGAVDYCQGQSVKLDGLSTNGSPWYYVDSTRFQPAGPYPAGVFLPNGIDTTFYKPGFTPADTGSIKICLISSNGGCPNDTACKSIIVHERSVAIAGVPPAAICQGGSVLLQGTAYNGIPKWTSTLGGVFSDASNDSTTYTPPAGLCGNDTLRLVCSNSSAYCSDSTDMVVLDIKCYPVANAGTGYTACETDVINLNGVATNNTSVEWQSPTSGNVGFGSYTSSVTTYTPNATDIANGSVSLLFIAYNAPCLADTDTVNIVILKKPVAIITTVTAQVCQSLLALNPIDFTSVTQNGTFSWSADQAGTFTNTTNSAQFQPAAGYCGPINFTLTTTDGGVCKDSSYTIASTIVCQPTASAGVDASICADDCFIFSLDAASNGTIAWTTSGDGTFNFSNALHPTYCPGPTDVFLKTVDLTISVNSAPCNAAVSKMTLTIHPLPVVTIAPPTATICQGDNTTLTVSPNSGAYTYGWSPTTDVVCNTCAVTAVSPSVTTTYTVTVTEIATGCDANNKVTVNVIPKPNAGNDTLVCIGGMVSLHGSLPAGSSGGTWTASNPGGGTFSNVNDMNGTFMPNQTDLSAGSVIITLTANGVPCPNLSSSIKVTVVPLPIVNAGPDQLLPDGYDVPLDGDIQFAPGGIWTTSGCGKFFPSNTTIDATYIPCDDDFEKGTVTLTLSTTGIGCEIKDEMIFTKQPIKIPNVVTTYKDDKNDYFLVEGLPIDALVTIYNRWGLKVYESKPYRNDFDAQGFDDGVYYYTISYKSKKWTGFFHVLGSAK